MGVALFQKVGLNQMVCGIKSLDNLLFGLCASDDTVPRREQEYRGIVPWEFPPSARKEL